MGLCLVRKVASREVHKDDSYLMTGTHAGADSSSTLYVKGAMFRALGVDPSLGQHVDNTTQSTSGAVTAADNETVTVSGVTWDYGDTFEIYLTDTKNSFISDTWTDVSRGWKINDKKDVGDDGWKNEDRDLDYHRRYKVFGPNQPEHN